MNLSKEKNSEFNTDYLGRLKFFKNLHIIDSSVLPILEPGNNTHSYGTI